MRDHEWRLIMENTECNFILQLIYKNRKSQSLYFRKKKRLPFETVSGYP